MSEITRVNQNVVRRRGQERKAATIPADIFVGTVFDENGITSWAPRPLAAPTPLPKKTTTAKTAQSRSARQYGGGAQCSIGFGRGGKRCSRKK